MKRFVYIDEEVTYDADNVKSRVFDVAVECNIASYASRATAEIVAKELQKVVMQVKQKYSKHEHSN